MWGVKYEVFHWLWQSPLQQVNTTVLPLIYAFADCDTITFQSHYVGSSFSHIRYISRDTDQVRIQRSLEQSCRKYICPQCKTSICNNSGSIKHWAIQFACSMAFSTTADRMVWPLSLSRDRKLLRVTKYTHLRVVGLRLEGILVL